MRRIAVAALVCCIAPSAMAGWDVAVTASTGYCTPILPLYLDTLQWRAKDGSVSGGASDILVIAPAPDGRVLGIRVRGAVADVVSVLPGTAEVLGTFTPPPQVRPKSMVVDASGNLIVSWGGTLMRLAQDGTILGTMQGGGNEIDVAADSCTVYVTGWSAVRPVNLCTGTYLPKFATGTEIEDVKLLPGGRVLIADYDALRIYHANGTLLRTIPTAGITAIAVADGGRTAYAAYWCSEPIRQWDLATGALLAQFGDGGVEPHSVVAHNAWTAAFGTAGAAQIPTLQQSALLALTIILGALALRRIM